MIQSTIRNKDVLNCLPLLASILGRNYGVKVEIGGGSAYTDGSTIHLPSLSLDCDTELLHLEGTWIMNLPTYAIRTFKHCRMQGWTRSYSTSGTQSKTGGSKSGYPKSTQDAGHTFSMTQIEGKERLDRQARIQPLLFCNTYCSQCALGQYQN